MATPLPRDPTCQDLERLPSRLSEDALFRQQTSKPLQWADDAEQSEEDILTTDTSGPATPLGSSSRSATPLTVAYCGKESKNVAVTCGVRAWTKHQAYGASGALIKYATGTPLLPQQVAEMVSNLSVIARVSLKAAAFFIEVILESVKNSTGMTLGITRRALISAVGTARAVHSLTSGEVWDAKATGTSHQTTNTSFLSILDKYTAVGIYLIHHTFTLTELFAMGTFQIIGTTLTAGLAAADESVRTIDGIFGSNETSRALASFITLVRSETGGDQRFSNDSTISILNKLTKAVTAFAVLQNSTYKRSAKSMKMRVIYDCTVLGEVEAKTWRSLMVGSGNFVRARPAALLASAAEGLESMSLRSPPRRTASLLTAADDDRREMTGGNSLPSSRSRGFLGDGLCLTDVVPPPSWHGTQMSSNAADCDSEAGGDADSLMADLDFLVGAGDEDVVSDTSLTDDQLPPQLRRQLEVFTDNELRDGIRLRDTSKVGAPEQHFRRVRKTNRANGKRETIYEITTEVIETIETETIETTTMYGQARSSLREGGHLTRASNPQGTSDCSTTPESTPNSDMLQRHVSSSRNDTETRSIFDGGKEIKLEEDEEWCEIRTTGASNTADLDQTGSAHLGGFIQADDQDAKALTLPEAPNGHKLTTNSKNDTSSKVPVVLKTMTRKLIQKRKTVRKIHINDTRDDMIDDVSVDQPARAIRRSQSPVSPVRLSSVKAQRDAAKVTEKNTHTSGGRVRQEPSPSKGVDLGRGLNKVLRRAKYPFKSDSSTDRSVAPDLPSKQPQATNRASVSNDTGRAPPLAFTSPRQSPSKSKRASETESGSDLKVTKRSAITDFTEKVSPCAVMKELPSIPQRGASYQTLFPTESGRAGIVSSTPKGSLRDSKRRNRAPSITSIRSFASRSHVSSLSAPADADKGKHARDATAFPQAHLVENLRRFMRYSSAAYGQNFMRILGIGSLDYFFPDTSKHHANVWAFAHHVGIPVDCILLNSFSEAQPLFTEQMSPLVNYVSVDDGAKAVVLTCRGTMGLSDILTDLTCDFETIAVEGGRSTKLYQVHSGMLASTRRLCNENSTVMQTVRRALEDNPDYGLVLTGHSLGGGVASLAAIELSCPADLFRQQALLRRSQGGHHTQHPRIYTPFVTSMDSGLPAGRPIHAYAYGVPAVASPDLSSHCKGLVTSIIHGHDFIPTLSLGMVRDFKNIAHALSQESDSDIAREIITRVLGTYRKRSGLRASLGFKEKVPEHLASLEAPRPQEIPLAERELKLSREELMKGKTRNLAADSDYTDPNLREDELDPFSYSSGGGHIRPSTSTNQAPSPPDAEGDTGLADWLWSLIKTIRADMDSAKLYPPGDVYCIESFPVFVTSRMQADSDIVFERTEAKQGTRRAEAHRVILRFCEDVEKRFSEPVFAKSMLRDHIPTNYELCMSLLYESVMEGEGGG
ncbi:lipase [Pseudozyma hubeiensis SY62]|uniref:sn-1-specific diacylglycerol lipase n=1 Tax=Pseudozyma hubeiensis (strain SY62) TaxID=1305764 RepID=R9P2T0_PSEHS|nr:lipase [Pseudozyma hubeiensis SY62]GAC95547.1 lipase [Pseudozyma hubeiensis SY62]